MMGTSVFKLDSSTDSDLSNNFKEIQQEKQFMKSEK